MQEIILKVRYFKIGLSKSLKTLTLFFLLNPVPFSGKNYRKQKGPGTSDNWSQNKTNSGYKTNSKKLPLLVMYYLCKFDDVI